MSMPRVAARAKGGPDAKAAPTEAAGDPNWFTVFSPTPIAPVVTIDGHELRRGVAR